MESINLLIFGLAITLILTIIIGYRVINKHQKIFHKYHLYSLILNIFSIAVFAELTDELLDRDKTLTIDIWVNNYVPTIRTEIWTNIMGAFTFLFDPLNITVISVIFFFILAHFRKWYFAMLLFCSMVGGTIVSNTLKFIIQRIRPDNAMLDLITYSYPSGHATMSTIFFSLLIYSFRKEIKNEIFKILYIVGNIIMFLMVGLSRVYLNVHWLTDVIAGFALGIFWISLMILTFKVVLAYRRGRVERLREKAERIVP